MGRFSTKRLLTGLLIMAAAFFIPAYLSFNHVSETFDRMETSLLDQRLRLSASGHAPSQNILILAMDERSRDYFSLHPELNIEGNILPHLWLAKVINYLHAQGVQNIVLDVEFNSVGAPEAEKPLAQAIGDSHNAYLTAYLDFPLGDLIGQSGHNAMALKNFVEDDAKKQHTSPFDVYKKLCLHDYYKQRYVTAPDFLDELQHQWLPVTLPAEPPPGIQSRMAYCRISFVNPDLMKAAKGLGLSRVQYDNDGILRSVQPVFQSYDGHYYPYMGLRVALYDLGNPAVSFTPNRLQVGGKPISLDNGSLILDWRNPALLADSISATANSLPLPADEKQLFNPDALQSLDANNANAILDGGHVYRFISVSDVIRKIVNPADTDTQSLYTLVGEPQSGLLDLHGKTVIYGDTIKDLHRTPVSNLMAGSEVIATVIDDIMHDTHFIHRTPGWLNLLIVAIMASAMGYAILGLRRLHMGFLSGILVLCVFWMYNVTLFTTQSLWIPIVWPTLIGLAVLSGTTLYRYYVQDREKRELTGVFSRYVSPQIMTEILSNPSHAMQNLHGSKKELTVLFADIQNFTSQFEDAEPEQIVQHLNEYFNVMTRIVLAHGGTCDKYMGDALMAFFGAPVELPNHAEQACRAALAMQAGLDELNVRRVKEGKTAIHHGIGVSTGPMFVGNFGSDDIKNFSVVGSTVNLGARLETQTRASEVPIIISEITYDRVKNWAQVKDLGKVSVKGFSHPVQMYALEGVLSRDPVQVNV